MFHTSMLKCYSFHKTVKLFSLETLYSVMIGIEMAHDNLVLKIKKSQIKSLKITMICISLYRYGYIHMCKYEMSCMLLLFYSTHDDVKGHMVVGNLCRSERPKEQPVHTDENKLVQQQPPPATNETEADNTESVTVRVDSAHELVDTNVQEEAVDNHSAMISDDNIPVTPLSNISHLQFHSTRSRLSSGSVQTGK